MRMPRVGSLLNFRLSGRVRMPRVGSLLNFRLSVESGNQSTQ
jgi:hypothetical protein